jgi:ABC-type dipeptide/oligopeptide/nickel transport system permease subunit
MANYKSQLYWLRHNLFHSTGITLAFLLVIASLIFPLLSPIDPTKQNLRASLQTPSTEHLLGTDNLGRDIMIRVLYAGRVSITATAIVLSISLVLGTIIGMLAGLTGGVVDEVIMRLVDVFLSFPSIILALAMIGTLGPGFWNLIAALAITWWPPYARLVRSKVLALKTSDYIMAAGILGASKFYIMRRHLLPALIGPVIVLLSLDVGFVILSIAGLGFLGLGIQPPSPEWGTMLVDARPFMQLGLQMVIPPGLAILVMILGFNCLSEALDEWLNPKTNAR